MLLVVVLVFFESFLVIEPKLLMFDVKKGMLVWKQATCQWCWWYLFVMRASNIVTSDGFLTISAITILSLVVSTLLRSFYFETKMKRKRTIFYYFYYNFYDWNVFRPLRIFRCTRWHGKISLKENNDNRNKNNENLFTTECRIFRRVWRQPF